MPVHVDDLLPPLKEVQVDDLLTADPLIPGNIDLHSRPIVHNPDGSISTVRSKSFNFNGKEVLLPTISPDGRNLSDDETVDLYRRTGQHLGIFNSPEEATAYAQRLHEDQAAEYLPRAGDRSQRYPGDPISQIEARRARAVHPQEEPSTGVHVDDLLDYVAAGAQAIGGLIPDISSGGADPVAIAEHAANAASTAGGYMAKHPGGVGQTQAIVSAVPFVGPPVAALAEPSIEYSEGTAPTHEANVQAVGAGISLATLLAAPKAIKKLEGRFGGEAPPEPLAAPTDKPAETVSSPEPTNVEAPHIDDLLRAAGEGQEAARNRPPGVTAPALEPLPDEDMRGAVSEQRVRDAEVATRRAGAAEPTDEEIMAGASQRLGGRSPADVARQSISEDRYRLSPEAALDREHLPVEEFIKQRFPNATVNAEAGPEWVRGVLDKVPDGKPGLSVEEAPAELQGGGVDRHIVYRDPEGRPVAAATIVTGGDGVSVRDFATDKSQGLLAGRAAGAIAQELDRMGVNDHFAEISPDAARFIQRAEAAKARNTLPGGIPHVDDLLDGFDEEPASGKTPLVPKYPWAQNIKMPEGAREPVTTPPAEPRPIADTSWLDDMPEAEQTPQAEAPMPQDLGGVPDQLTSHPEPTSPENVQQMIGTDAEKSLDQSVAVREKTFQKGPGMASQIYRALIVPGDDVLLKSGAAGQEAVRVTRPIELVRAQAVGKADALYHDITQGMTKQEAGSLGPIMDMIQRGEPIPAEQMTPRISQAIHQVRGFFDDYLARAKEANTGVEAKKDFFPHFRVEPVHDIEKPLPEFQRFGMEAPSLHYHQIDDRPGYSTDLGYVMRKYAYNAETELQAIRAFGAADADTISKKIDTWANQIAATGGDGVLTKKILLQKFNIQEPELPAARRISRDISATVGAAMTPLTWVRHIGKYANAFSQIGVEGFTKGAVQLAKAAWEPEARSLIRESGVMVRNDLDMIMSGGSSQAYYHAIRSLPWIKAVKTMDLGARIITYFGSDPWINETMEIARGEKTFGGTKAMQQRARADAWNRARNIFGISEEGINSGNITPEERAYARLAASDVTEFGTDKGQLPYAANVGAGGRIFYNMKKFATSQWNFHWNNIITPASYGNLKPLARWAAASLVAGAIQKPLMSYVLRRPDAFLNAIHMPGRPEGDETWDEWRRNAGVIGAVHSLGLGYLVMEGKDLTNSVPGQAAALFTRGTYGALHDLLKAAEVSGGVPTESENANVDTWESLKSGNVPAVTRKWLAPSVKDDQEDLPAWWAQASENLKNAEGKHINDISRSNMVSKLMQTWYREARGLPRDPPNNP